MKTLKTFLASLFKNTACIDGARRHKWYAAIIIFVLSMGISIIPTIVNTVNTNGSDFLLGTLYDYEMGLVRFSEAIYDDGVNTISLEVVEDTEGKHYLKVDNWNETFPDTTLNRFEYKDAYGVNKFEVYYAQDDEGNSLKTTESFSEYVADIYNNHIPGTEDPIDGEKDSLRSTSFMVIGRNSIVSYRYQPENTNPVQSFGGDYVQVDVGFNFNTIGRVTEEIYPSSETASEDMQKYIDGVFANWEVFFNESFANNKIIQLWQLTGIVTAINVGLVLFMGLMIFILTRGRANPFRIFSFWDAQKIVYWASFTPALLALIAGFILPDLAAVAFVFLLGMRVMWLSMRTLKPGSTYIDAPPQDEAKAPTIKIKK